MSQPDAAENHKYVLIIEILLAADDLKYVVNC